MVKVKLTNKPVPQPLPEVRLKQKTYTNSGGGRGLPINCHNCMQCIQGNHQECEDTAQLFCRCWRTKHTEPPPVKRGKPPTTQHRWLDPPRKQRQVKPKPVVIEEGSFVFTFDD